MKGIHYTSIYAVVSWKTSHNVLDSLLEKEVKFLQY
jgi:hypothetical protein